MAVWYLSKAAGTVNSDVISDFLLCCRTFK